MTERLSNSLTELAHRSSDGVDVTLVWLHGDHED